MFKKAILVSLLLFWPGLVLAEANRAADQPAANEIFEARVIKILEQREIKRENGAAVTQQNLLVRGLEGNWRDREIEIKGISDVDVVSAAAYKAGDKVLVQRSAGPLSEDIFYIIDFVRSGYIYFLAFIFVSVILVIGQAKGLKALIGLAASFLIIIKFILPRILTGSDPLLTSLIGAFLILVIIIYLSEGWNRQSHLAILTVLISLAITLILSFIFSALTRLSGFSQEESVFLIDAAKQVVDFKGLLLAGMLIGAVGVLDDVIVGQIETVKQIKEANPGLNGQETFKRAYLVGNTHLGAIVNTLFLTYAGASLPLLLLFTIRQEPFVRLSQIINNQLIATEIVRTLVGSIGVALSLPIATYLAAHWLKKEKTIE